MTNIFPYKDKISSGVYGKHLSGVLSPELLEYTGKYGPAKAHVLTYLNAVLMFYCLNNIFNINILWLTTKSFSKICLFWLGDAYDQAEVYSEPSPTSKMELL